MGGKIIRNSRREETFQIRLKTYEGVFYASAPSGKSKGKFEVDSYNSRGIGWSSKLFRKFAGRLLHKNFLIKKLDDLKLLWKEVNKFENRFGKLGGNITYTLELVFLKAAAKEKKKEIWEFIKGDSHKPKMPMPVGNCIGGGMHSILINGKKPDFQEFLLIPQEKTFSRAITKNIRAYEFAEKLLKKKGKWWRKLRKNDENAWMTNITNEEVLEILHQLKKKYGVRIGLDVAASSFFSRGYYHYKNKELMRDRVDQMDYIEKLAKKYGLFYIEDPLDEEDFSGFVQLNKSVANSCMIVGDDLTVTNLERTRRAVRNGGVKAVIVKPNQIGSLLEVKKVVEYCKENKIKTVFSHRSGETMDDALADICIGFSGDFIKTGIYGRERLIKLRRIMEIERR